MSQLQTPDFESYEQASPDLSLVDLNKPGELANAALEPEQAETEPWPTEAEIVGKLVVDYLLAKDIQVNRTPGTPEVDYQKLVPRGAFDSNPDYRLRVVWKAVEAFDPTAIMNEANIKPLQIRPRVFKFLEGRVSLDGEAHRRRDILNPTVVARTLDIVMRPYNDPVVRALDSIEAGGINDKFTLQDFALLKGDVLLTTKYPIVVDVYTNYIALLKTWAKALPNE